MILLQNDAYTMQQYGYVLEHTRMILLQNKRIEYCIFSTRFRTHKNDTTPKHKTTNKDTTPSFRTHKNDTTPKLTSSSASSVSCFRTHKNDTTPKHGFFIRFKVEGFRTHKNDTTPKLTTSETL